METLECNPQINHFSNVNIGRLIQEEILDLRNSIDDLEKVYFSESPTAKAAWDYTNILSLIDRVKEFAENRQFYQLYNALEHGIDKIDKDIRQSLRLYASKVGESYQALAQAWQSLEDIVNYSKFSEEPVLEKWAESLEEFGDLLEDYISFFSIEALQELQSFIEPVIEKTQKKSANLGITLSPKNSYRVRIRNAAGFIVRLIDYVLEESETEEKQILREISDANHPVFFEE